ncbi:hypothetical protein BDV26DRAFT_288076 [Aspergillus bertholletiae]|uniref:Uncharacterized protein n=1 Tax=Aspergillus bertholletiae TaxID=1226010 RepID=A0A5N7BLU5_9EURO|nr:hypothetical protein BDV26DRAFT_288076 [Aspergillus bertholletiae]
MSCFFGRSGRQAKQEERCARDEPVMEQSKPNMPAIDEDSQILSQCNCGYLAVEARSLIYRAPAFSLMETKDPGLDYLTHLMDLLEDISFCGNCSNVEDYRVFLQPLCYSILGLCQLFYRALKEMYIEMDLQPISPKGKEITVDDDRSLILCQNTYLQIERLHSSVQRLIKTLKDKPAFDGDAWWRIDSGAYRLVVCTASLSGSKPVLHY